jgi:class 3 adenylate cyclase/predicted ATPase
MQQVADWLKKLGMSEYAECFAENDIDFALLDDLTDQDLKELGVASLGHRRKMLRAIAELGNAAAAPVLSRPAAAPRPASSTAPPPTAAAAVPEAAGERRYLTVMFCDLAGSTGISAQLDAEEWRDLVGSYVDAASAAVTEMGGHVAKKLGDGILALFGYPVAHENDAERAARAALAIQRALAELNRKNAGTGKPELAARIGLETGPAVVDAAGEIYGDVANIAARVQALAEPGAVLITARVQRQVAGLFVAEERGTHTLKGVPEPTALFRLVRASGGGRRSGQRQLTPLVGRDDEMTMLLRRWERARQGDGQLVIIVGEPGLGKSRLIEEFHGRLSDTPHTWVEWSCSQLLQNTPLHPIAEWGRARFGGADVPAERRLAELESSLAQVKLDPAENTPLLAPLLDIPLPKDGAPALAPEELRRRQLAALTNWVMAGAKVQPVVLAFEDLHWADPTTLDVLRGIAERGALAPLLIVATTRPEFRPPWSMRSHHGTISLAPLDRAQVRDMVAELSAQHALPKDVVEDVAARTGGVPLFVEEVTRLLLERGGESGIHAIPPTLQQSLMARLDRLGPAREVAQVGSVIGRGFSYRLLRDVAGLGDAPLQAALEKLAEADVLLVQGAPPESDYRFKHALIQDAAYENLLKSRRQVLHRRAAETLRERFADTAAAEPEALAYHFTQAGMTDAAIEWWGKAGDQALRRSAFQEAISHLGKAIEMADSDATRATTASAGQRFKLQTNYGLAVAWSRGFAAAETAAALTRAHELSVGADNSDERFTALYGQWVNSVIGGDLGLARKTAETFLREAESGARMPETVAALRYLGMTLLFQGHFVEARTHLEEVLRIYDPDRDREAKFRFGTDSLASATIYLAQAYWHLGDIKRARELSDQAVARAVDSAHGPTLVNTWVHKALFESNCGNADATEHAAEALAELSREHGLALYLAYAAAHSAWAHARLGDNEAGIKELRQALAALSEQGVKAAVPLFQGLLAELEAKGQGAEEALRRIDQALALASETGEHQSDAFLHRIRGEILWKRDPANTAPPEEAFLTAIAVAQQQNARSFELRAALSLAKLYQSTNRAADAHAVLVPALEGFSPTPEFPEIEEAQALLAALAASDDVKNTAAARQRRLKLQTSYGQAMMWSKGYAAPETAAAFARAQELAAGDKSTGERFVTYYGQWGVHLLSADLDAAAELAAIMLREAGAEAQTPEALAAHRLFALASLCQGNFVTARTHSEKALRIDDSAWDRDSKLRFGQDSRVAAIAYLAHSNWQLGDLTAARELIEKSLATAKGTAHSPTLANTYGFAAMLYLFRGDAEAVLRAAKRTVELSEEHALSLYLAFGNALLGWAHARLGDPETGATELGQAVRDLAEQGNKLWLPLYQGLLAQIESDGQDRERALATIEEALALADQIGGYWASAFLHRIRGEILLKRDPANTAPAEETFLTAIAVAQQQKARSFGLQAALSLAKLHQSTGRPADAHAVLAPALEGFSPTPEFPEIAEAQALLAALAASDDVKNAAAARQRRLKLQTSYGQAVMWSKGFGAEETKAAFLRARELGVGEVSERFPVYYGLWVGSQLRGELRAARETAEIFLRDAESEGCMLEAAVAHRALGLTLHCEGYFVDARTHLEEALRIYDSDWDRDTKFRFGMDTAACTTAYLAHTNWQLGEVQRARHLAEEAMKRATASDHAPTLANTCHFRCLFEMLGGNAGGARHAAETLVEISRERQLPLYQADGMVALGWTHARLGDRETGITELRQGLASLCEQGSMLWVPFFQGQLAQIESEGPDLGGALGRIDKALALARDTGQGWSRAFLHRIRGEILLKRDPENTAPAEEAFRTAIGIAQQQKAKSFELQAALALAKLYQSGGRAADAHAVLAPVLAGFAPTPEFPEIAEARQLLGSSGS